MVEFDRETQTARLHSPLEGFEEVAVDVEVREDPLTGRGARIVPDCFPTPEDEPEIASVVDDAEGCVFCPGAVRESTPTYAGPGPDGERGRRGEATSFPNLNPYGAGSNVVVLTEDHYRPLDELGADRLHDGLALAVEYVRAVTDATGATVGSVNVNFLRPAGASLVHPHMQTLVDDRGTNVLRERRDAARVYAETRGERYHEALVAAEAGGDRHAGTTGAVEWLAPFAPHHHRHLLGVAPGARRPGPEDDLLADLARGIAGVLAHYADRGLNSFNLALHLPDDDALAPHVDLVARAVFDRHYWSDSPFFATLHDEGVIDVAPETYAAEARPFLVDT
jgi:galactose-1-phosphate uridylyltransferase